MSKTCHKIGDCLFTYRTRSHACVSHVAVRVEVVKHVVHCAMDADIDGAHFAIHVRMVRVMELLLSPRARLLLHWIAVANCAFCCLLLVFLHVNYVCINNLCFILLITTIGW
jgi:hypothetical protein